MKYDVLSISPMRKVILCGAHVYPNPELHPDRIMQEHDLMYVVEGEWRVFQDNVLYHLRAGDMFFLRAGSHHYTPYLCAAGSRNMFIHFNRLPEDRYEVDISANKLSAYANNAEICLPTLLHCGDATPIPSILKTIIDIFWSRRDDQQRTLTLQLNILLNELSYIARNTPTSIRDKEEWINTLLSAFRNDQSRIYSLEEAAALVGMQVRTLSTRFRKLMGTSIHQYQVDMKLEMAYHALSSGVYTVKQVSEIYGFCDPYYFSRVFKEKYRVSPKEIKQRTPSINVDRPWMNT